MNEVETEIRELLRLKASEPIAGSPMRPLPMRRIHLRRARNGIAAAVVVTGLSLVALTLGGRTRQPVEPVSPVPKVRATFSIPGDPTDVAYGFGSVWISTHEAVLRIDPTSGEVQARIDSFPAATTPEAPGPAVNRLVVAEGAIWVLTVDDGYRSGYTQDPSTTSSGPGNTSNTTVGGQISITPPPPGFRAHWAVVRIDPDGNAVAATPLVYDSIPSGIAVSARSVWVTSVEYSERGTFGYIQGFDLKTREPGKRFEIAGSPNAVVVDDTALWVAVNDGRVVRIDPGTGTVEETATVQAPGDLVLRGGSVWVTSRESNRFTIARLESRSLQTLNRIRIDDVPEGSTELIDAGSYLWLVSELETTERYLGSPIRWLDPIENTIVGRTDAILGSRQVAGGDGVLWITGGGTGDAKLWRIDLPQELR